MKRTPSLSDEDLAVLRAMAEERLARIKKEEASAVNTSENNKVLNWMKRFAFWIVVSTVLYIELATRVGLSGNALIFIGMMFIPATASTLWAMYKYDWFNETVVLHAGSKNI